MRSVRGLTHRLPSGVAVSLGVRSGEKVVAWAAIGAADSDAPAYAVATTRALYAQSLGERVAWHRVSKATWEEPVLTVVLLDEGRQPGRVLRIRLDDARDLPPAVYDRVTDSVSVGTNGGSVWTRPGSVPSQIGRAHV